MNKQLRKTIEAELTLLISAALTNRNKQAAADVESNIKEGVKSIAKKFVKRLPEPASPAKKTGAVAKAKPAAKKAKTEKTVKTKTTTKKAVKKSAKKPVLKVSQE